MSHWDAIDEQERAALTLEIQTLAFFCKETQSALYLLLDRGDIDAISVDTARLLPVPDWYFDEAPWLAPQLLPLKWPDDQALLQEALACAVYSAADALASQPVSGVLAGALDPKLMLDHFATLGVQYDPVTDASDARLFRYQDPRVMQRVWPTLTESQRLAWLGPVRRWCAAVQPASAPGNSEDVRSPVLWRAERGPQAMAPHRRLSHLFDIAQWRLAHSAPAENTFWRLAANEQERAVNAYPSAHVLRDWVHEAASHGLSETDQTDWALCCWAAGQDYWYGPIGQDRIRRALALRNDHAGLSFGDAWHTVGQRS